MCIAGDRSGSVAKAGRDGAAANRNRICGRCGEAKSVDRPWSPAMAGDIEAETTS